MTGCLSVTEVALALWHRHYAICYNISNHHYLPDPPPTSAGIGHLTIVTLVHKYTIQHKIITVVHTLV